MERLRCKACGCFSMIPMDVSVDQEDEGYELPGLEQESRFYTCHVCGDNWLSVKETDVAGDCKITFIHQMGMEPVLKRVAHLQTEVLLKEDAVDRWEYYLDDQSVESSAWQETLADRRKVLRSICSN